MNIKEVIIKSINHKGEPSSSRIFAYTMQLVILCCGLVALGIEICNAIVEWKKGNVHIIPWEHITIMGMWLAHQLTLLGIYKANETKVHKLQNTTDTTETVNS